MADWEESSKYCLLLAAMIDLTGLPRVMLDGELEIPSHEREHTEHAIELASDLIAVAIHTERRISSPSPFVALYPESDAERVLLQGATGFAGAMDGYPISVMPVLDIKHIQELSDRTDGVRLMAEVVSQSHGSGKFRELTRLFERAFGCNYKRLPQPLVQFLDQAPHPLRYTKSEVNIWINEYRDSITHGGADQLLFGRQVTRAAHRMEQAAYDVLFNKADWGVSNASRRRVLELGGTSSGDESHLVIVRGQDIQIIFLALDGFGVFSLHLNAPTFELPEGWWAEGGRGGTNRIGESRSLQAPMSESQN